MAKEMRIISVTAIIMLLVMLVANVQAVVEPTIIDFDDLWPEATLSGTTYAGLTWEWGNEGAGGIPGEWYVPSGLTPVYPYSEPYNVMNAWGSTLMGIGFPETVNVVGAYFAGAGASDDWSPQVRVHGYLGDTEVAITDWFDDIDATPSWFAMNLSNIDRIVIEAIPIHKPGIGDVSRYGMDNLTYVPEPATVLLLGLGGLTLLKKRRA